MKNVLLLVLALGILVSVPAPAHAQQPELATYRETAHVLVDKVLQNETSAFVTLSTVSNLEMRVPTTVDDAIHNAQNVTAVSITNSPQCVFASTAFYVNGKAITPGQSCVVITILDQSLIDTHNFSYIENRSQAIGDSMIGKINSAFGISAQPFQVYVRPLPPHEVTATPGPSRAPDANASINVVYTFPYSKTSYLFDTLSSILLPDQIRGGGGFFDAAKQMATYNDSTTTFEILPQFNNTSLYQLQVARFYPLQNGSMTIKPLDLFGVSQLNRSSYFNVGFFPLNSLVEVSAVSHDTLAVTSHGGGLLPTEERNGQKVPTDLTQAGWIFDPDFGKQIFSVYLFGKTTSVDDNSLWLTLSPSSQPPANNTSAGSPTTASPDYSVYIIIGIVIAGGGAIYLFTRRR